MEAIEAKSASSPTVPRGDGMAVQATEASFHDFSLSNLLLGCNSLRHYTVSNLILMLLGLQRVPTTANPLLVLVGFECYYEAQHFAIWAAESMVNIVVHLHYSISGALIQFSSPSISFLSTWGTASTFTLCFSSLIELGR
ncbi:hypothetical protein DM860_009458 [Cuscuta australis]|uniref:Uncharacterized protein n=1 Tax=Cuscuta australis TaxID=267555 RepID=A0A328DJA3_9ASTE|nr:hypothetical protein DM860_009458 [Cuscuta australis]